MNNFHNFHGLPPSISYRNKLGIGAVIDVAVPDEVLSERLRRGAMNRASITAAICGDPLPGESAYERGPEVIIKPYDPSRNFIPYRSDISTREMRWQAVQIRLSSRNGRRRPATAQTKGEGRSND